jgi:ribosome biogenesis GTPase
VREHDGKGRHTTTVREMHRLERGGWLMDTPGMREFQLSDAATGLAEVFDDIALLTLECRFTNCTHTAEPGCAIQAAIESKARSPPPASSAGGNWRPKTLINTGTPGRAARPAPARPEKEMRHG